MSLGPAEIMMVLLVALVLFGPKRLPEVGRQVGGALRELRKIQDTVQHEMRSVLDDTMAPIHHMTAHPTPSVSPPARSELPAGEPDLGDEKNPLPEPDSGIDGLSGGTFS